MELLVIIIILALIFDSFLTLQRYENQAVLPQFQPVKNDLEHYFFLGSHRLHR